MTGPESRSNIPWLPSRSSVLGVAHGVDAEQFAAAVDRLRRAYEGIPALAPVHASSRYLPTLRAGICVVGSADVDLAGDGDLVWGAPLGRSGLASSEEVELALTSPVAARELSGVFVLVRTRASGIRLVTSATIVATLRTSAGALATRATAAAVLGGRRVEVNKDAVAEAVVWQCALRTGGEVVAGVEPVGEASVVDLGIDGAVGMSSYWDAEERLAPQGTTTPEGFRSLVAAEMSNAAAVDNAMLGLTAGLDSTLAASCLDEVGGRIDTFTMGHAGYPDLVAARAVARRLGWSHETALVADAAGNPLHRGLAAVPGGDRLRWLVAHAPWADGMCHPRDAILGRLRWKRRGVLWVAGHGGETARSVYGSSAGGAGDTAVEVATRIASWAPPAVLAEFMETIREGLREGAAIGRPRDAVDVLYLRRQFTWIDRALAVREYSDMHPLYMGSRLARAMLDVPPEQRADGAFIRRAHELGSPDLSRLAAHSATRGFPWVNALRRGPWRPFVDDWPLLHSLLQELEPDGLLARDALGDGWWCWALETAPGQPWARSCLWNAIAVESLHRWTEKSA